MSSTIVIPARFCGPPGSANGGYACGVAASFVDGSAEVTLRSPPPLDRPLHVERTPELVRLCDGDTLIAEARPTTLDLDAPPAPTFDEAVAAAERFPWRTGHMYPGCFVCGPDRRVPDGLCVFPGAVTGREVAAAPLVPDDSLTDEDGRLRGEIVWSALDCPSWFGYACFHDFAEGRVLLGRLAARIDERPRAGTRCVCAGWFIGRDGRKLHCGSALYGDGGQLLAVARATWIIVR